MQSDRRSYSWCLITSCFVYMLNKREKYGGTWWRVQLCKATEVWLMFDEVFILQAEVLCCGWSEIKVYLHSATVGRTFSTGAVIWSVSKFWCGQVSSLLKWLPTHTPVTKAGILESPCLSVSVPNFVQKVSSELLNFLLKQINLVWWCIIVGQSVMQFFFQWSQSRLIIIHSEFNCFCNSFELMILSQTKLSWW